MYKKSVLVTGGAGFIGSNFLNHLVPLHPDYQFVCLDALTYAGNLANLSSLKEKPNFVFAHGSIEDEEFVDALFDEHNFTHVVNMAAESHVDRSIVDPNAFVKTNVLGTVNLLHNARRHWLKEGQKVYEKLFVHVSTDEVYGSLSPNESAFTERHRYDPHSPYSASKASSDHFVRAYADTYGLPVAISNCSNNYGPYQFPEKLIPLVINNIIEKRPIPVYGDGLQVRDWLFVLDHVRGIEMIMEKGQPRETYNIGGNEEKTNLELIHLLIKLVDKKLNRAEGSSIDLITHVKDRPGHDVRYAIDASKIRKELGWKPSVTFEEGIEKTVNWYLDNEKWFRDVVSGDYRIYYNKMYSGR